jgi:hypothetical protein
MPSIIAQLIVRTRASHLLGSNTDPLRPVCSTERIRASLVWSDPAGPAVILGGPHFSLHVLLTKLSGISSSVDPYARAAPALFRCGRHHGRLTAKGA